MGGAVRLLHERRSMGPRKGWDTFDLVELPVPNWERPHFEKCMVCARLWHRSAMAYHEATHAAVALDLGLKVQFVAIDEDQEIEVTRLEAQLYPVIRAGMKIPAMATRLDEKSLRAAPKKVLVAMVAPSCVHTGHRQVDNYAALEALLAVQMMEVKGFDKDEILDWALRSIERSEEKILSLARQLAETGWVDLG